jgi:hypothetical protein
MSILSEYLDSKNSYKLRVNRTEDEELRNYLLDIGIILAHMRPNIVVKFKIDSTLSQDFIQFGKRNSLMKKMFLSL